MAKSSLNNNKQNYFKNLFFKQNFKIHSLNIGDHKMKNLMSLFIIVSFCLFGFSVVAKTIEVGRGGTEIEVGNASPKTLELRNTTGKTIKDVWVNVISGDGTKITKMNLYKKDGTDLDDKVDDDMDGQLQNGEDDNDFPAGGVTKGRTILGDDIISHATGKRDFKLVIHFDPMGNNVKIKVMLSEEDNTGYHTNVCIDTPLNDGGGLCSIPGGNDLVSTDIINNGINPVSVLTAMCSPDLYVFENVSLKAPFENSIVTVQDDIVYIELHPFLSPNDSLTMFANLSNPVESESEIQVTCNYSEAIPTLSEWGVIILLLLVLAVGMVFLYQRQAVPALAGVAVSQATGAKPRLFDRKLFAKVFAITLLIGFAGLLGAYLWFGKITSADPFGVIVSAAVVAYMVQLGMLKKEGRG
ncbi:MAG: hypothetical protein GX103_10180 [Bacteroidales bacterium]|nr:hypothetical protein [Bacteroidales bacterium]